MALALEGRYIRRSQRSIKVNPLWLLRSLGYRLWWHTKAYATILGVIVLALLSMVVLYLYRLSETHKPQSTRSSHVAKDLT